MKIAWPRNLAPLLLLPLLFWTGNVAPQSSPASPATAPTAVPTIEQVQAKLAALATIRDLPETERTQAKELYQQAISQLQAAKNYADNTALFQQLQQSAPTDTARLQQSLIGEPPAPPSPSPSLSTDELTQQQIGRAHV